MDHMGAEVTLLRVLHAEPTHALDESPRLFLLMIISAIPMRRAQSCIGRAQLETAFVAHIWEAERRAHSEL